MQRKDAFGRFRFAQPNSAKFFFDVCRKIKDGAVSGAVSLVLARAALAPRSVFRRGSLTWILAVKLCGHPRKNPLCKSYERK
jgi:hypothetical protein